MILVVFVPCVHCEFFILKMLENLYVSHRLKLACAYSYYTSAITRKVKYISLPQKQQTTRELNIIIILQCLNTNSQGETCSDSFTKECRNYFTEGHKGLPEKMKQRAIFLPEKT